MKVFRGRFIGTGCDKIVLMQATEWVESCFENVFIDDTGYNLEYIKNCYFENCKFKSGMEFIGIPGNHFYPVPNISEIKL